MSERTRLGNNACSIARGRREKFLEDVGAGSDVLPVLFRGRAKMDDVGTGDVFA